MFQFIKPRYAWQIPTRPKKASFQKCKSRRAIPRPNRTDFNFHDLESHQHSLTNIPAQQEESMKAKKRNSPLRKTLYVMICLAVLTGILTTGSMPTVRAMGDMNLNGLAKANSSRGIVIGGNVLSNGQFVYGPNVGKFNTVAYLKTRAPHLAKYGARLYGRAEYFSINPKVYITLLEIQSRLISEPNADKIENPFGLNSGGFLAQIDAVSKAMVDAYYLHLYSYSSLPVQEQQLPEFPMADGKFIAATPGTNAGTYAILAALARMDAGENISVILDNNQPGSFFQTYLRLFPGDDPTSEENQISLPGDLRMSTAPVNLLQLPYSRGESWNFNGVHDGAGGTVGSAYLDASSIDFSPGWPGWGADTSNMWVVAAASGTPTKISACNFKITHADGWQTVYYHLENIQPFSGSINQNDRIGVIANTLAEATCDSGSSTGPHVHFTLKLNGALVAINGTALSNWVVHSGRWNYDSNTNYMWLERSGTKKYVGNLLLSEAPGSGTSCPAPSLSSPGDGFVSSSQTVNFSWSALSGCTFNGYTFRIKDTNNMDSGGTNIVDTGEGSTSRTETIGTQWNNRDLYWGVRAANAPNGASWSVRRFRIEPGSSCGSYSYDGIVLFRDAQCSQSSGGPLQFNSESRRNLTDYGFNDLTRSIHVGPGWSVRIWEHIDGTGATRCITGSMWDLSVDNYDNGSPIISSGTPTITTVDVYHNSGCSEVAPATPSNLRQSSSTSNSITMSWDDVSNETEYRIREWNGSSFVYLASVGANVTSFTETRSSCGWDEFYTVSAYNNSGESPESGFVQMYTQSCPVTDDAYEENDTLAAAYDLSSHENTWLSSIQGYGTQRDADWYRIDVTPDFQRLVIDLQFTHADGDIDLALFDAGGAWMAGSASTDDNEHIDTTVPAGGIYYIKVYYADAGNTYDLWWDDLAGSSSGTFTAVSSGTRDGWVLESSETSSSGGTKSTTGTIRIGDDAGNRQYRGILYFDTSSLPVSATINSVTLKIKKYSVIGTNPFNTHGSLIADIRKGTFGYPSLDFSDFQAASSKQNIGYFQPISGAPNWYQLVMNSLYHSYINAGGITQFRLRFAKDDNNDWGADFLTFIAGEAASGAGPVLIIEYTP